MTNFVSDRALGIQPYTAGEQPSGRRYVKLNTNENPYPPSPCVEEAIRSFDAGLLKRYPKPNADGLRKAIAEAEGVAQENVFVGNGSDEVLALSFPAFFDVGSAACFADFTYSFYEVFAAFFGVNFVKIPIKEDFDYDFSTMLDTPCKGYYIANPNAPTGVGVPIERMEAFIAEAQRAGKIVVADEAYMDFFQQSCVPLTKRYCNLLVVKTFSKSYSLAGIRCGYAIGSSALIDALLRMKDCFNSYPVDALCQAICTAAIGDGDYRNQTAQLVIRERERVREELLALGFTVPKSSANFLFAGRAKRSGKEIYEQLKEHGVLVRFWDKPFLRDFCRITIGTKEENDELIENLKLILR